MMISSKNLNEILSNTKTFRDNHGIGYNEEVLISKVGFTKFVNAFDQDIKLKSTTTNPRGKYVVSSQLDSFRKVNPSPKASTFRHFSSGFCLYLLLFLFATIVENLDI